MVARTSLFSGGDQNLSAIRAVSFPSASRSVSARRKLNPIRMATVTRRAAERNGIILLAAIRAAAQEGPSRNLQSAQRVYRKRSFTNSWTWLAWSSIGLAQKVGFVFGHRDSPFASPLRSNILFVLLRLASTAAFILVGFAKDRASG